MSEKKEKKEYKLPKHPFTRISEYASKVKKKWSKDRPGGKGPVAKHWKFKR